jgi:polyisoprenoid-binding protein YceI
MDTHFGKVDGETRSIAQGQEQKAPERWELDERRSRVKFKLLHLVVHQIGGRFERCGGTLFLDRDRPSLSSVEVWVDLASISTDSPERDDHVRSAEFLDVARFPRATFTSTTVDLRDGEVLIDGRLDLHGVVRDIELVARPATTLEEGRPAEREVFTARATINRQAFGLHWNQDLDVGGFVLGDDVDIEAEVEVVRSDDPGP